MEQNLTHLQSNSTNATHQEAASKEIMGLLREVHS